jgi:tRNA(Ile)-lysidine synthase TilS/MesJ
MHKELHLIAQRVYKTINQYNLFNINQEIIVGFSGGKDSLITCLVLRELKCKIIPIYVDMGYVSNRKQYVCELAKTFGISVTTLNPRDEIYLTAIKDKLQLLDNTIKDKVVNYNTTPCTWCSGIKLTLLKQFALSRNCEYIVLCHSASDANDSLIKFALMYIDRWKFDHEVYDRKNYLSVVEQLRKEMCSGYEKFLNNPMIKYISNLINNKFLSTEEPPKVRVSSYNNNLFIVRPCFDVFRYEIAQIVSSLQASFQKDGCEKSIKTLHTPRELVRELFQELSEPKLIEEYFHTLITKTLNYDGSLSFDPKIRRLELLGEKYRMLT